MRDRRLLIVLLLCVVPVALAACGGRKTPEPAVPTESAETGGDWPALSVVTPTVQFREHEQDALRAVLPGEAITVPAGGNVVVAPAGRGALEWPGFLSADLLGGTDVLLSLSQAARRYVIVDQAGGTARYVLQGDEAADVRLKAAWANVAIAEGVADVLLSVVSGTDPAVWVAVLDGEAVVTRGETGGERATVTAGQVIALGEAGALPAPIDIDRSAVLAWYGDRAVGKGEGDIAIVAFRCATRDAETILRAGPHPEAEPVGDPLGAGAVVAALSRDESGEWLQVRPVGRGEEGWVPAEDLACVGPVSQVRVSEVATPEPTATTPVRLPTRVIVVSATPLLTLTPTPTPTAGSHTIRFWAEDDDVECGKCTVIRWETENIREVYFEGHGVAGNGSAEVCVNDDTSYTLRVVLRDGSESKHALKIECHESKKTAVPPTAAPPTSAPPTSEPPTPEPPTSEPPTSAPPTPGTP